MALSRLQSLVRERDALCTPFQRAVDVLSKTAAARELDAWAQAALDLANANAGPGALLAFWQLTVQSRPHGDTAALVDAAQAAAEICRNSGAAAARAVLNVCIALGPAFWALIPTPARAFWGAWLRLSREAPACVVPLTKEAPRIVATCGPGGFSDFVAAGLRSAADRHRRLAFFAFEDPSARLVLDRLSGSLAFSDVRQRMRGFATALWGLNPPMESGFSAEGRQSMRRTSIAGGCIRVPEVFAGVPAAQAELLFSATVAHATAHLALGKGRFAVGSLKPLQVVLVGLIEDARIEALAMRRFPGLRRLWAPFHVAEPSGMRSAPALLARLSRALFDPAYEDSDGFVNKARTLLYAVEDLEDPENARRIGGLLGNDLGQMRIQFDVKSYVVEPVYRDDGLGLWDFPEDAEAQSGEGISIEAALVPEDGTGTSGDDAPQPEPLDAGRAKPAAAAEEGIAVATYPEWDRAAQTERPDWTTVREVAVPGGNAEPVERAIEREQPLRRRIERLVRAAKVGRQQRLRRQPAGPEFDLDAVVESAIAARAGREPGELVFKTSARRRAGLATSILIDVSQSTRDPVPALQTSIVELEKLAVAILAAAMEAAGDTFALRAFASDGRHDVRFHRVKDFVSPFDWAAKGRLASLAPGFSTRLGAALRHAGSELAPLRSSRKVVLALTDGAPSDIDVADPLDLIEDARRAVFSLRAAGIEVFGILLDPTGAATGASIFGRANTHSISRIEDLPGRLSECYFRLTRR